MSFKSFWFPVFVIGQLFTSTANAAEWKAEPSLGLRAQYNDNVGMRSDDNNPQSSTAYTLDPRVKFSGEEERLWDASLDTRAKLTRYQDIEDVDSNNIFVALSTGYQTERSTWRLNANVDRNTSFDTDFDTASTDAILFDDRTERNTTTIAPSYRWNMGETSTIIFSLNTTSVSFDEVKTSNLFDFENDTATFQAYWGVSDNHTLGFTTSYIEQVTPDVDFSSETTIVNIDYTYNLSQNSSFEISLGGRRLNSLRKNGDFLGCETPAEFETFGTCVFSPPVFGDLENKDNGTVVNLSYTYDTERISQNFNISRNVAPSSNGSVQELQSAKYALSFRNTKRLTSRFTIDALKSQTISGIDSSIDVDRYRVEPSINYKLTQNWNLSFLYRYVEQNLIDSDADSTSNAVYVNLQLLWPKLATTY